MIGEYTDHLRYPKQDVIHHSVWHAKTTQNKSSITHRMNVDNIFVKKKLAFQIHEIVFCMPDVIDIKIKIVFFFL